MCAICAFKRLKKTKPLSRYIKLQQVDSVLYVTKLNHKIINLFSTAAFSRGCVRLELVRSLCQGVLLCDDFLSGLCDPSPPSRTAGATSSGTCTACSPGSYSASPGAISPSRQWILPLRIVFGQWQYLAPVACSLYPELHCSSAESTLLCRSFLPHFLCYV